MRTITRDEDYVLMIISAVRYALPRHSYMVSTTQNYIKRHWKTLQKMHWCILKDIREYIEDDIRLERDCGVKYMGQYERESWMDTYNTLLTHPDTKLPSGCNHLFNPIQLNEDT